MQNTFHINNDKIIDNLAVLKTGKLPVVETLGAPSCGSISALKMGNACDLYFADGDEWHQITSDDAAGGLPAALAINNNTGGNDISVDTGDKIVGSQLMLQSPDFLTCNAASVAYLTSANAVYVTGDSHVGLSTNDNDISMTNTGGIQIQASTKQVVLRSDYAFASAVDINATAGGITMDAVQPIVLTTTDATASAVDINATAGGITMDAFAVDINATGGIRMDAGQAIVLATTSAFASAVTINATGGGVDINTPAVTISGTASAATPTLPAHLTTKGYVDGLFDTVSSFIPNATVLSGGITINALIYATYSRNNIVTGHFMYSLNATSTGPVFMTWNLPELSPINATQPACIGTGFVYATAAGIGAGSENIAWVSRAAPSEPAVGRIGWVNTNLGTINLLVQFSYSVYL